MAGYLALSGSFKNMKEIKNILICLLISSSLFAMDIYDEVANSIRSGDARQLATFFSNSIDLTIVDKENVYSKDQAEFIIKDFFSKNPPKAFNILHKGSSPEGTQYLIGNLVTTNGKTFRTSFYIKTIKGKSALQELRFEVE
jgi:hypothetical protein